MDCKSLGELTTLTKVRLAFCDLVEPKIFKGKQRYQANALLPEGSPEAKLIEGMINDIVKTVYKGDRSVRLPAETGTGKRDKNGKLYEGYEGMYVLRMISNKLGDDRPVLYGPDGKVIERDDMNARSMFKSGYWYNVKLHFWVSKNHEGVNCELGDVQFVKKDKEWSGAPAKQIGGVFDPVNEEDEVAKLLW